LVPYAISLSAVLTAKHEIPLPAPHRNRLVLSFVS